MRVDGGRQKASNSIRRGGDGKSVGRQEAKAQWWDSMWSTRELSLPGREEVRLRMGVGQPGRTAGRDTGGNLPSTKPFQLLQQQRNS